jgi:hypothetical protein
MRPSSLLKYSHPRLFGGIGTLASLASPQICPNTSGLLGRFGRLEIAPIALKNPSARVIQQAASVRARPIKTVEPVVQSDGYLSLCPTFACMHCAWSRASNWRI